MFILKETREDAIYLRMRHGNKQKKKDHEKRKNIQTKKERSRKM